MVENVEVLELDEVSAATNWMLGDLEQATRWGFVRPSTNSEGSFRAGKCSVETERRLAANDYAYMLLLLTMLPSCSADCSSSSSR